MGWYASPVRLGNTARTRVLAHATQTRQDTPWSAGGAGSSPTIFVLVHCDREGDSMLLCRCFACLVAGALLLTMSGRSIANPPPSNIPDQYKINGFAVGCQAYTFNHFSVMEAIEKTS